MNHAGCVHKWVYARWTPGRSPRVSTSLEVAVALSPSRFLDLTLLLVGGSEGSEGSEGAVTTSAGDFFSFNDEVKRCVGERRRVVQRRRQVLTENPLEPAGLLQWFVFATAPTQTAPPAPPSLLSLFTASSV